MIYITVADVNTALGATWAPESDKARYAAMANAYMDSLGLTGIEEGSIPANVVTAGIELAEAAVSGKLYVQMTEGELTSKSVKAGSVTTAKTFASVSKISSTLTPGMQFALSLLHPWMGSPFAFSVGR